MTSVTLIGGEKGGTGKSTLATNLAVWKACHGEDVLIIDADRQGTAANWASTRSGSADLPKVHCVQRYGNIMKTVTDLKSRYQSLVIDAGGRDAEELRSAMVAADIMISPLRASQSDLWTVDHLDQLVKLARGFNASLKVTVILSMTPSHPRISEPKDACDILDALDGSITRSSVMIRERKVYRDAIVEGRGVIEMKDKKAAHEIDTFAKEIYGGTI